MSIIKKPVITEKMTLESEKFNRYAFVVDRKANKIQIKKQLKSSMMLLLILLEQWFVLEKKELEDQNLE